MDIVLFVLAVILVIVFSLAYYFQRQINKEEEAWRKWLRLDEGIDKDDTA